MQNVGTRSNANRGDGVIFAALLLAALGFALAAYKENVNRQLTLRLAAEGRYNASPDEVLGTPPASGALRTARSLLLSLRTINVVPVGMPARG